MIKEVKMYTVICDNCGADSCDCSGYAAWSESDHARYEAEESGFITEGDKHYCPRCISYDEEDNLVLRKL